MLKVGTKLRCKTMMNFNTKGKVYEVVQSEVNNLAITTDTRSKHNMDTKFLRENFTIIRDTINPNFTHYIAAEKRINREKTPMDKFFVDLKIGM